MIDSGEIVELTENDLAVPYVEERLGGRSPTPSGTLRVTPLGTVRGGNILA